MEARPEHGNFIGVIAKGLHALVALLAVVQAGAESIYQDIGALDEARRRPLTSGEVIPGLDVAVDAKVQSETEVGPV